MRWPWQKAAENRAGGYGDRVVNALLAQASGQAADSSGLAALEIAAGLWARGFSVADVAPDSLAARAVTPEVLAGVGRELVRSGEALFEISLSGPGLKLLPVGSWSISGGPDPESWFYLCTSTGPGGAMVRRVIPAAGVLHFRYATDPRRPWAGISPLAYAGATAELASNLEKRLAEEVGGPVGSVIPVPSEVGATEDDPLQGLRADLNQMRGAVAIAETTQAGYGEGRAVAPTTDWRPIRIGAHPPEVLAGLRSDSAALVLAACGIGPSLGGLIRADGGAQREAYRRFLHSTIVPALALVASELQEKLDEPQLTMRVERLFAGDLTGRARALGQLTTAGVPLDQARRIAGLE